jgi:hypothetical protein
MKRNKGFKKKMKHNKIPLHVTEKCARFHASNKNASFMDMVEKEY